ncbi:MFS transporter [Camelimonas fluminis]|uniref:MFS transporter n=1 Tax=Camelimonas fluminis TaxID=1576911 RepID=A0ABV7UF32_9HYPH|nr:MFS transporter [Camelimonas fluminis]
MSVRASGGRSFNLMLCAMASAFLLSQAYRTFPGVTAGQIAAEFSLSQKQVGEFAALFHLAFALMQVAVGVSLDRYGSRRTLTCFFSLTIVGALVAASASSFTMLMVGQALIGFGCAPGLLASLVFIGRHLPPEKLSAMSGLLMSIGSIGTLMTATPLAWLVEHYSWRAGFVSLGLLSALSVASCLLLVEKDPENAAARGESIISSFKNLAAVVFQKQAAAILLLAGVIYAVQMSVRALWLAPLFMERFGYSLVAAGNVVLMMSVAMIFGPAIFGRLDPGPRRRRLMIRALGLLLAALIAALGMTPASAPMLALFLCLLLALEGGFGVLQYSDCRDSYPPDEQGRALSALTMAMFLGVAVVQWLSAVVAGWAALAGLDSLTAAYLFLAALCVTGVVAFTVLPQPPRLRELAAQE